ncbi:MAG: hypothetical protein K6G69_07125 [Lachnospiraceae bacterium]|nr:hypothetical protein [Lachnospiraceae bacterium]
MHYNCLMVDDEKELAVYKRIWEDLMLSREADNDRFIYRKLRHGEGAAEGFKRL